jgi:hypothetical protein
MKFSTRNDNIKTDKFKNVKLFLAFLSIIYVIFPLITYVFYNRVRLLEEVLNYERNDFWILFQFYAIVPILFFFSAIQKFNLYVLLSLSLNFILAFGLHSCYGIYLTTNFDVFHVNLTTISNLEKIKMLNYFYILFAILAFKIDSYFFKVSN